MKNLEERNLVWNLVELIIEKHGLENSSEFLDPIEENKIIFGNFVKGHPMCFEGDFRDTMIEINEKLPSNYDIAKDYLIDDGSAVIGIVKKQESL